MARSWNYGVVMPQICDLVRRLGVVYDPDGPRVQVLGAGDVLFWSSWGIPHLVEDRGNGRQRWEHGGVVLLVLAVQEAEPRWIEVKGYLLDPPHTETGAWRWPEPLVEDRLRKGSLTWCACVQLEAQN